MRGQYIDSELEALNLPTLKPCPFCGGEAEITQRGNEACPKLSAAVRCKTLGCTIEMRRGGIPKYGGNLLRCITLAIKDWNTRVQGGE